MTTTKQQLELLRLAAVEAVQTVNAAADRFVVHDVGSNRMVSASIVVDTDGNVVTHEGSVVWI